MKKYKFLMLSLLLFSLVSCDDFLSERPSKSSDIVPTTIADMETILAGLWRMDCSSSHIVYMSDDTRLSSEMEKSRPGAYTLESVMAATWERGEIHKLFTDYMWIYRYQNIFRSNLVLTSLSKVVATESEIARVKSEACFRRAYSYMGLTDVYTLPYSEKNLKELGLVLIQTTGFSSSLKRSTIEETYAFIEKDILEAVKINVLLENKLGQGSVYRVTNASANALAARFYLMKNDYSNAKKYAQAALNAYGESNIMDYNELGYAPKVDKGTIKIDGVDVNFEVKYPATEQGYDFTNKWTEDYFLCSVRAPFGGFTSYNIPSQSLIDCYTADGDRDKDMRWKYFYVSNYIYLKNFPVDLPYFFKPAGRNYCITVPEMLLIVAECEARVGDYSVAMQKVNTLRAKRIAPDGEINLSASSKDDAIAKVLRERRRELPLMMRLYDIRRYNSNDYTADDVTVTRYFYTYNTVAVDISSSLKKYELKPNDRRYAAPIPECDILAGNGVLEQNKY